MKLYILSPGKALSMLDTRRLYIIRSKTGALCSRKALSDEQLMAGTACCFPRKEKHFAHRAAVRRAERRRFSGVLQCVARNVSTLAQRRCESDRFAAHGDPRRLLSVAGLGSLVHVVGPPGVARLAEFFHVPRRAHGHAVAPSTSRRNDQRAAITQGGV